MKLRRQRRKQHANAALNGVDLLVEPPQILLIGPDRMGFKCVVVGQ